MKKYLDLFKNIGLLTISNFGSKVLSFILIPIYTNILSTAEYGTFDIYSTTISLLIPILTLNISNAVMRFRIDNEEDDAEILSVGIFRVIVASIIVICIMVINHSLNLIAMLDEYAVYFVCLFIGTMLYELFSQYARGSDHISTMAVAGVINSLVMLIFNVAFLVYLNLGLKGYFLAYCLGYLIPVIYYFFRLSLGSKIKIFKISKSLKSEMQEYSKPLVIDSAAWWITNVSDRYFVSFLCGIAENGVYSVAYKIPSVLNVFQDIFNKAWVLSAVKTEEEDRANFYTTVYSVYNCGMVFICSILILLDKVVAELLFAKDFYVAWKYAPFLMISVVFGALSGLCSGIFSTFKKTRIVAITTFCGAITNLILNYALINLFGTIGAAIATMTSYIIVWALRIVFIKKIVNIDINFIRDIISYLLLLVQAILLYLIPDGTYVIAELGLVCIIGALYFKQIAALILNIARSVKL